MKAERKSEVKSDWIIEIFISKEIADREKKDVGWQEVCGNSEVTLVTSGTNPCYFRLPGRPLFLSVNCITVAHMYNLRAGGMFMQERFK
jgi:hypothetical protein